MKTYVLNLDFLNISKSTENNNLVNGLYNNLCNSNRFLFTNRNLNSDAYIMGLNHLSTILIRDCLLNLKLI